MGSTRWAFTEEYKAKAVALVLDGGRTNADVARSIGVHEMTSSLSHQLLSAQQGGPASSLLSAAATDGRVRSRPGTPCDLRTAVMGTSMTSTDAPIKALTWKFLVRDAH